MLVFTASLVFIHFQLEYRRSIDCSPSATSSLTTSNRQAGGYKSISRRHVKISYDFGKNFFKHQRRLSRRLTDRTHQVLSGYQQNCQSNATRFDRLAKDTSFQDTRTPDLSGTSNLKPAYKQQRRPTDSSELSRHSSYSLGQYCSSATTSIGSCDAVCVPSMVQHPADVLELYPSLATLAHPTSLLHRQSPKSTKMRTPSCFPGGRRITPRVHQVSKQQF